MALSWNLAAGFAGSTWAALMGVAFVPVYIRYLGPEGWGAVGFFVTLQGWLSIVDAGLSPAFNREFARFRAGLRSERDIADLFRSAELLYLASGLITAALVWGTSHWLAARWLRAESLDPRNVEAALQWLGLVIAGQWLASLYRQALLGLERQVMPHLCAAAAATVRGAATWIALVWVAPTLPVFVGVQFALVALEVMTLRTYLRYRVSALAMGRWAGRMLAEMRGFAAGLAGVSLLAVVLTQGDKLLLSALLPLDQFGLVMVAVTVAGCLGLATSPIFLLSYPRVSRSAAMADEAALVAEYRRWSQWLAVLVLPAAALLVFFARDLLTLWTRSGELAASVAPLLALWTIGSTLNALMHIPYAAQLAHGWTRLSLLLNTMAVALLAPLTLWLVPRYGAMAAAWIWAAVNLFYVLVGVQLMHRRILRGQAKAWYSHALLVPAFAAFAVVGTVAAWRQGQTNLTATALLSLIALALFAGFTAAVLVTPEPRRGVADWLRRRELAR